MPMKKNVMTTIATPTSSTQERKEGSKIARGKYQKTNANQKQKQNHTLVENGHFAVGPCD
jgi:hypothetical protein